jgi:hypothetical protein
MGADLRVAEAAARRVAREGRERRLEFADRDECMAVAREVQVTRPEAARHAGFAVFEHTQAVGILDQREREDPVEPSELT